MGVVSANNPFRRSTKSRSRKGLRLPEARDGCPYVLLIIPENAIML